MARRRPMRRVRPVRVAKLGSRFTLEEMKRFAQGKTKPSKVKVDVHGYDVGRKTVRQRRDLLIKRGKKVHYLVWGNRIATYNDKTKKVSISSAGWETNLTKDRLNRVIPSGQIIQEKFVWKVKTVKGKKIPFKDGMSFNLRKKRGKVIRRRKIQKPAVDTVFDFMR